MPLTPLDLSRLPAPAQKVLDPSAPGPMRAMAAKGVVPGLKPADLVTVVCALAAGEGPTAETARATLRALPTPLLNGALGADLEPAAIDVLLEAYVDNADVAQKLLAMPRIEAESVERAASKASELVTEIIATNEQRLLAHPAIIEKLYLNKKTRMSTADRLIELAVRNGVELQGLPVFRQAAAAIQDQLIVESGEEPTPEDIAFREVGDAADALAFDPAREDIHDVDDEGEQTIAPKFRTLQAKIAELDISQKVRLAVLGNAAERLLLMRDQNRLVATAAITSPQVREEEIRIITKSKECNDEVLRLVAQNGKWVRVDDIKFNLVVNPRTPFTYTSRLVPLLREHRLKELARSKNVPAAVQAAARQHLSRKDKS